MNNYAIASKTVTIYDWRDIRRELCRIMGIAEDKFRDYHEIVGGEYKDFWHVCMDTIVPDHMANGTIVVMWSTDADWYEGDQEWKNTVLKAWNTFYDCICGVNHTDPGIYVEFSW